MDLQKYALVIAYVTRFLHENLLIALFIKPSLRYQPESFRSGVDTLGID